MRTLPGMPARRGWILRATSDCCVLPNGQPICITEEQCCSDAKCVDLNDPSLCLEGRCNLRTNFCFAASVCANGEDCCEGGDNVCCPSDGEVSQTCCGPTCCDVGFECCERTVDGVLRQTCIDPATQCCTRSDCVELGFDADCVNCNANSNLCRPRNEGLVCDDTPCGICDDRNCVDQCPGQGLICGPNGKCVCDGPEDCNSDLCQDCTNGECLDRCPALNLICNGQGVCVECLDSEDCTPFDTCTPAECLAGVCKDATSCAVGETCCPDGCVDTDTDESNCGACDNACAVGETCCDGVCKDLSADPDNCGTCGFTCEEGDDDESDQVCCEGLCQAGRSADATITVIVRSVNTRWGTCRRSSDGTPCDGGTCCPDGCVDTDTDENNCGACENPCAVGETCCDGVCKDLQTDEANCGTCGLVCTPFDTCTPAECLAGVCNDATSCAVGETCCPDGCVDTDTDENNCGACDNACAVGETCCDGVCKDLQTDEDNCGTCGTTCPVGQTCCSGFCKDLSADPDNCGTCGFTCEEGDDDESDQVCCEGFCQAGPFCGCDDNGDCAICEYCDVGTCRRSSDGTPCDGGTCCPDGCVDTDTDENNCGACDNECAVGETCAVLQGPADR